MRLSLTLATLLALSSLASEVSGQACTGSPSFAAGPVQLSAGGTFADDASSVGAGLYFGAPRSIYVGGGISRISYDGISDAGIGFGGGIGYDIDLTPPRRPGWPPPVQLSLCPFVGVSYENLPYQTFGDVYIDGTQTVVDGGLGFGASFPVAETISIIPFASIAYIHNRVKLEATSTTGGYESGTGSDDYGNLSVGSGFLFNERVAIRPSVSFPIGVEDANAAFSISVDFQLGGRKRQ